MELISSSPHDNGVTTLYDRENKSIIKSSHGEGRKYLSNEMLGFEWYSANFKSCLITKNDYIGKFGNSDKYLRVTIREYPGKKFSPYQYMEKKFNVIKELINHYFMVWRRIGFKSNYPIHGDFSVGNCVRQDGQILLFDWEHFRNDAAPFGFDVVNLYYESVFFALSKPRGLTRNRTRLLKEIKLSLSENLSCELDFRLDLNTFINYLNQNENHWGNSFKKLPALNFSPKQIDRVYAMGL